MSEIHPIDIGDTRALEIVVGFDSSPAATRALAAALALLHDRPGSLHVVYVLKNPVATGFTSMAYAEMVQAEEQVAQEVEHDIGVLLANQTVSWQFERRSGQIGHELVAAADSLGSSKPGSVVVIVVGRSTQAVHQVLGSVPVALAHHSAHPVLMVP